MSRFSWLVTFLLGVSAGVPAFAYDASWYKANRWSGEYPYGFTMAKDVTIKIRENLDPNAPKTISCQLKKGATYHQWNSKRVKSDKLEFVTFTKSRTNISQDDGNRMGDTRMRIAPIWGKRRKSPGASLARESRQGTPDAPRDHSCHQAGSSGGFAISGATALIFFARCTLLSLTPTSLPAVSRDWGVRSVP
jgi:hypothetical protein